MKLTDENGNEYDFEVGPGNSMEGTLTPIIEQQRIPAGEPCGASERQYTEDEIREAYSHFGELRAHYDVPSYRELIDELRRNDR